MGYGHKKAILEGIQAGRNQPCAGAGILKIRGRAARSLGIKANMLGRWIKEHESADGQAFRGNGKLTAEQAEIRQLREENRRLKMEKEILKKRR